MHLDKEKIKVIMARQELTTTELAGRCGKTKQRISTIFNSVNVSPRTAGMIAKGLDVDVTEIIAD